jgi:hypothetical protein
MLALFTGKIFELVVLFTSFVLFRYIFPSTLHLDEFEECIACSIILLSGALIVSFGENISIYSSVLVSFILCLNLYVIDYIAERLKPKIHKHNRDRIIELLNGDTSTKHILEYCKRNGIREDVGETVDLFLRKTINEVCDEQYLSETAVKKRIKTFIEKRN